MLGTDVGSHVFRRAARSPSQRLQPQRSNGPRGWLDVCQWSCRLCFAEEQEGASSSSREEEREWLERESVKEGECRQSVTACGFAGRRGGAKRGARGRRGRGEERRGRGRKWRRRPERRSRRRVRRRLRCAPCSSLPPFLPHSHLNHCFPHPSTLRSRSSEAQRLKCLKSVGVGSCWIADGEAEAQ
eukprot:240513-Rhodomonas_salina.1